MTSRLSYFLAGLLALTATACSNEIKVDDATATGGGDGDGDGDVPSEVGIDERPANATCIATGRPPAPPADVALVTAFPDLPGLAQPLFLTQAPNDRFYLVEKEGRILTFTRSGADATPLVTLSVDSRSEGGLLGMAFHPAYGSPGNRQVFLSYTTAEGGQFVSRVSRFTTSDDGTSLDANTEQPVLRVVQDQGNHNGGWIGFGPDGYLYAAFGDGGGSDDEHENGQEPTTLKAKVLRIDIDRGDPYAVPADNPFLGSAVVDEAFAWGLRNPWRASFDTATGTLWLADVGQGDREEVDIVRAGANLGWPIREGTLCFDNPPPGTAPCDTTGLTDPVHEYDSGGPDGRSITGGYVYRGNAIPGLAGKYVFGDYRGDEIWALTEQPDGSWTRETLVPGLPVGIASFGQDNAGELYAINLNLGTVQKLVANDAEPPASDFPERLSETGCMDETDPRLPGPMLIPYEPAATLWSDDADKQRWLALPDGETIDVMADGDFDFPVGSVLVKQFAREGRLLETRFYLRHSDGDWGGYTYRWNDAQTDAFLLADAGLVETENQSWRIPSRAQCQQCHTAAAGFSLGLEVAQLNNDFSYPVDDGPNRRANQLRTLEHIGVLAGLPAEADRDALPRYDADAPVEDRARAYLHSNCSNCHRPDGGARGQLDLRYQQALADTGLCAEPELDDFGVPNPRILAPGAPDRSIFLVRMNRTGEGRMPQIGTVEVDDQGTDITNAWIESLDACE